MCLACEQEALPISEPAEGFLRFSGSGCDYVGKDAGTASLTIPARLPAGGPALAVAGPGGWGLYRYYPGEDVLGDARSLVLKGAEAVAVGEVAYVGSEDGLPVTLLCVERVVRPVPEDVAFSEWAPPLEGLAAQLEPVRKARPINPLNPRDFDRIIASVSSMITPTAGKIEQAALVSWLNGLNFNWKTASDAELLLASRHLNTAFARASGKVWAGIRGRLDVVTQRTVKDTASATVRAHAFDIDAELRMIDRQAARRATAATAHFIRDYHGNVATALSADMRRIARTGIERGISSTAIAKNIRTDLGARLGGLSTSYYNIVSNAVVHRSRTFSQLATFRKARIEIYRIEAILDETTTNTCRLLHGREFEVGHALGRYAATDAARDPTDVRYEQPWTTERLIKSGKDAGKFGIFVQQKGGALKRLAVIDRSAVGLKDKVGSFSRVLSGRAMMGANISAPPYHARCRTIILPMS